VPHSCLRLTTRGPCIRVYVHVRTSICPYVHVQLLDASMASLCGPWCADKGHAQLLVRCPRAHLHACRPPIPATACLALANSIRGLRPQAAYFRLAAVQASCSAGKLQIPKRQRPLMLLASSQPVLHLRCVLHRWQASLWGNVRARRQHPAQPA